MHKIHTAWRNYLNKSLFEGSKGFKAISFLAVS